MEKKKLEEPFRVVLIDPATGKIISDPQRERNTLQRTIRDAALVGNLLNVPKEPGPVFNEDQSTLFFSEITTLLWEHKSFMDKEGFIAAVQSEIDEKLKRTNTLLK
jgi:hypothetical protein